MIKCTKVFTEGKPVLSLVPDDEYPHTQEFTDMVERMKAENCHTFIMQFDNVDGLQVLFTLTDKSNHGITGNKQA